MRFPFACALFAVCVLATSAQAGAQQVTGRTLPPLEAGQQSGLPGAANERAIRARDNLAALIEGRLSTSDLSPQELQDVLDFERMVRGEGIDNRSPRQQCVDAEVRRNGGSPTRLAWQVIRLKCR
jgi:hypothetical protein